MAKECVASTVALAPRGTRFAHSIAPVEQNGPFLCNQPCGYGSVAGILSTAEVGRFARVVYMRVTYHHDPVK